MSIEACAALVEKGDPDRFLAAMAAPPVARRVLFPLYAFNLEVARAPWVTEEPMIAEMRLQWWRDALDEIASDKEPRRHEVVTPLAEILTPEDAQLLDAAVEARRWDVYKEPFESEEAFRTHIQATSGHLMLVAARRLGPADEVTVRAFAYGAGVASWLRAIPDLEARGRIPLLDGTPKGIKSLAESALTELRQARRARDTVSKAATPALLAGWRAEATLKRAAAKPQAVADGALNESEFTRRFTLLKTGLTGRW